LYISYRSILILYIPVATHGHSASIYMARLTNFMLWQGNAIYAEIPANLAEQKAPDIEEEWVYNINRFRVCAAKNTFQVVDGDKMVQFTLHTIVKHVINPPTVFPTYVYRLTPFDQIESNNQTKPNFLCITTQRLRIYYLLLMAYVHLSNIF
jgi:hypothetical protein